MKTGEAIHHRTADQGDVDYMAGRLYAYKDAARWVEEAGGSVPVALVEAVESAASGLAAEMRRREAAERAPRAPNEADALPYEFNAYQRKVLEAFRQQALAGIQARALAAGVDPPHPNPDDLDHLERKVRRLRRKLRLAEAELRAARADGLNGNLQREVEYLRPRVEELAEQNAELAQELSETHARIRELETELASAPSPGSAPCVASTSTRRRTTKDTF